MATDEVPAGLWLIGIGPGDLGHMTERARSVARGCKKRYLEGYTAVLPTEQEALLESVVGPWERMMRPSVESPEALLDESRNDSVALLVVGDPMQATTHIDLEARCMEEGIGFEVIPGMSATSLAVSLSGLQSYKFGRQVTLPYPYGDYLATSPLEMILRNLEGGLHTLVLLDLDPTGMGLDLPTPMSPSQAISTLGEMEEKWLEERDGLDSTGVKKNALAVNEWEGVLLSDVGTKGQRVFSGSLKEISKVQGGRVHSLIIPSEMSDNEREAFSRRGAM
ncbi:MAG: diphthine synthase [Candidatus Thalassarchaeum sp.]|jgi:diphthine synthase|nr:diphthine synthase [Candidatus Thalassarchaeum sp.]MEC7104879.1 diphthine synthase [Candidatus Thermoplasmatota archaeon]